MIKTLPEGEKVIGLKTIKKGIDRGEIDKVVVSKNCPNNIKDKIKTNVEIFDGNQIQLGTVLGKPFPIAAVGIKSGNQ